MTNLAEVSQLKVDLKKKEEALNGLDKKLKDANGRVVASNGVVIAQVVAEVVSLEDESPCQMLTRKSCSCSLNKEMEASASNTRHIEELFSEIELLRERNKVMEDELKEMQERYSEISLKFAEVEGERQQLVMKLRNAKKNP
ncbi:hypothetical protein HAX54_044630 [Datura stramonium]|uniref:Uncharacterized protein n=1 Tax=Datura stramonium TaxID=4076 RepID=A0ABS8SPN6_DATST|nr:hypothetical protein [Datura stramonium]